MSDDSCISNLFVLVDVYDVDDVPAARGPPVHVDLEARLPAVLQHLQRELGPTLPARALQHLISRQYIKCSAVETG